MRQSVDRSTIPGFLRDISKRIERLERIGGGGTPAAVGGGGLTDGDKGDIVVALSGDSLMFDPSVVTAAARSVLNDTTTAAMRTTLGVAPLVVQATQPTAADYGLGTIPVGAIWVRTV